MKGILMAILLGSLTGCAALDPLGSPKLQQRDPNATYTPDYPTRAGIICRELNGTATVRDVQGAGRGFRCMKVGSEDMQGCFKWGGAGAGFSYESPGCLEPPADPQLAEKVIEAVTGSLQGVREQIQDTDKGLTEGINEVLYELGAGAK